MSDEDSDDESDSALLLCFLLFVLVLAGVLNARARERDDEF